jgi:hypothetical protein
MCKESHESGRRVWFAPASGRRNYRHLNGHHTCSTTVWQNEHAQSADERAGSELRKQRRQHQSEKQRHFGVSVVRRPMRTVRISSTGRTISVCGTTAVSMSAPEDYAPFRVASSSDNQPMETIPTPCKRAITSLQHLMAAHQPRTAQD